MVCWRSKMQIVMKQGWPLLSVWLQRQECQPAVQHHTLWKVASVRNVQMVVHNAVIRLASRCGGLPNHLEWMVFSQERAQTRKVGTGIFFMDSAIPLCVMFFVHHPKAEIYHDVSRVQCFLQTRRRWQPRCSQAYRADAKCSLSGDQVSLLLNTKVHDSDAYGLICILHQQFQTLGQSCCQHVSAKRNMVFNYFHVCSLLV